MGGGSGSTCASKWLQTEKIIHEISLHNLSHHPFLTLFNPPMGQRTYHQITSLKSYYWDQQFIPAYTLSLVEAPAHAVAEYDSSTNNKLTRFKSEWPSSNPPLNSSIQNSSNPSGYTNPSPEHWHSLTGLWDSDKYRLFLYWISDIVLVEFRLAWESLVDGLMDTKMWQRILGLKLIRH